MDFSRNHGELLTRLLQATEQRHRVLAGNIANQNTPGFKRRDVRFEKLLAEALDSPHADLERVAPELYTDEESRARADGNNVDLETEHARLRENLLRYELYSAIARGRSNILRSAIHGDR